MNMEAKVGSQFADLTKYTPPSDGATLEPWPAFPAEIVLGGDPAHKGIVLYRDPTKRYTIGVWTCPPCKFRMPYAGTESGHVLRGKAKLTNERTGTSITISAGDKFMIPFGDSIIWEVLEDFQKHYHMYEAEFDPERYY